MTRRVPDIGARGLAVGSSAPCDAFTRTTHTAVW